GGSASYRDFRRIFNDKTIDAVVIALPNRWHALATVWACQAGKDVYVEKPFSYNLWEGQQMVAAARKYGRMVQVGTQNRSSTLLRQAFDYLRSGQIGCIRYAHALVYRARDGTTAANAPTPAPTTARAAYQPAPQSCEVRNVRDSNSPDAMGKFRNQNHGLVIDCEGGYFAGDASGGALFDKQGKKIKDFPDDGSSNRLETSHMSN